MIKAGIIGSTGYVGEELVRILCCHPYVKLAAVSSQSYIGEKYGDVYQNLNQKVDLVCEGLDIEKVADECDIIFLSMPHGHSVSLAKEAVSKGKKVIDMGSDFRFDSPEVYEKWYHVAHGDHELLKEAVYGLTEVNGEKIEEANIIGNPGCYPTSIILGLAPLLAHKAVIPKSIIIDSKSGISGAGKSANASNLFTEINGNIRPYNIGNHRHIPEINQELSKIYGDSISVTFVPQVVPMSRGMMSNIYCDLNCDLSDDELHEIYNEFYKDKKFIRLMKKGIYPQVKWVCGSNYCDIGVGIYGGNRAVIVSAIDNLIKGAAGQAVQNMNIMFGFPEDAGLTAPGLYL